MAKQREIYICALCGNVVEVECGGKGKLACCGEDMRLVIPNTMDASVEKHVPAIEKKDDGILVKVGSAAHPMADDHYIAYIDICDDGVLRRKYLKPGMPAEAFFKGASMKAVAKAYCNKHGLWRSA
ncbi:MAG: desulfoferrodoxin [Methanomassiliicoccaceae archaeon]|jgi:superoxide reductase|nr:desulfoferrodoxin [Methanomassiliicoccaceae archaeon]